MGSVDDLVKGDANGVAVILLDVDRGGADCLGSRPMFIELGFPGADMSKQELSLRRNAGFRKRNFYLPSSGQGRA